MSNGVSTSLFHPQDRIQVFSNVRIADGSKNRGSEARTTTPPISSTAVTISGWKVQEIAGRMVEISGRHGSARLTAAFCLVLDAQMHREPTAWVTLPESTYYPPDAAEFGVDLSALPVIRAPDGSMAVRAAEELVRSGAFGLIVMDLGREKSISMALQTRILGLAQKHDTAVVFLTEKQTEEESLSSLISLRAEASTLRIGTGYSLNIHIIKDKRKGPGRVYQEECCGPAGLH
ncbi:MAG: recombinase A [Myxococcales bacterium]|nr:recombinase A [Myxococcales bacterium]